MDKEYPRGVRNKKGQPNISPIFMEPILSYFIVFKLTIFVYSITEKDRDSDGSSICCFVIV